VQAVKPIVLDSDPNAFRRSRPAFGYGMQTYMAAVYFHCF